MKRLFARIRERVNNLLTNTLFSIWKDS